MFNGPPTPNSLSPPDRLTHLTACKSHFLNVEGTTVWGPTFLSPSFLISQFPLPFRTLAAPQAPCTHASLSLECAPFSHWLLLIKPAHSSRLSSDPFGTSEILYWKGLLPCLTSLNTLSLNTACCLPKAHPTPPHPNPHCLNSVLLYCEQGKNSSSPVLHNLILFC